MEIYRDKTFITLVVTPLDISRLLTDMLRRETFYPPAPGTNPDIAVWSCTTVGQGTITLCIKLKGPVASASSTTVPE